MAIENAWIKFENDVQMRIKNNIDAVIVPKDAYDFELGIDIVMYKVKRNVLCTEYIDTEELFLKLRGNCMIHNKVGQVLYLKIKI